MRDYGNTPITLAFIITVVIFLILSGASIMSSVINNEANTNGLPGNISWIWVPTVIALVLSVLLAWGLFWKKKE